MGIEIKSEKEIAVMRQAGKIVAEILMILTRQIQPGMKTKELDIIAERELKRLGAESSFKGYRGYPATICVSVNDEIVHGIPGDRVMKLGDVTAAIQSYAASRGYAVVREYTGHGIGRQMHEDPQIPNSTEPPYGLQRGTGPTLKKGMTLALEPMLNAGGQSTL